MKVLWLSHFVPYPPKGGAMQRTHHLLRGVSRFHEIRLLCFNPRGWYQDEQETRDAMGAFTESIEFFPVPADSGLPARVGAALASLPRRRSISSAWLASSEYALAVDRAMREYEPDLVYVDTISLWQYVAGIRSVPLALNHHNIESHMMLRRKSGNPLKRALYRFEGRKILREESEAARQAVLQVTCSELDSERLAQASGSTGLLAIPNAVDTDYFRFQPHKPGGNDYIFVGGLSWYPNVEAVRYLLDEIWPLLKAEVPDSTLTIVGRNAPDWLVARAELDSRVSVPGFVDDVRPIFRDAAAFLCPIQDGGGTKLKVLDCLANGTPLVAHPIACEGIDVAQDEEVMFAETPREYVDSILRLRAEPALATRLSENGRRLIERNYTADAISQRLAEAMAELVR